MSSKNSTVPTNTGSTAGHRFSWWIVNHPYRSMLLILALSVVLLPGIVKLESDFTHRGFFKADDPLLMEVEKFERRFGNDDSVVLVVHSPSGIFDEESAELLLELTEKMWRVPEIIRVTSLSNYRWVHATGDDIEVEPLIPSDLPITPELLEERRRVALEDEMLPGYLISEDAKTTAIFGFIKPGIETPPDMPTIVAGVEEMIAEAPPGDHVFHVTGRAAVNASFKQSMQGDMQSLIPFVLLLTVVFLLLSFRRLSGVFLPLVVIFGSIMVTLAAGGWLGLKMTNTTSVIPQILIAIGIADSVHVLYTYYSSRRRGLERREATAWALTKNLRPTVLTTISTAIGFFSFTTSDILAVWSLGIMAGIGTLLAWGYTYFLLGPLLALLPLPIGRRPKKEVTADGTSPRAEAYTSWLERRRYVVIVGLAVIFTGAGILSLQNTVNSNPYEYFAEGFPVRVANDFVEENLGGTQGVEIVIRSGEPEGIKNPELLRRVEEYQRWIDQRPGVTRTISIVDILKQTNRSLHGGDDSAYTLPETRQEIAQQIFLYTMNLPQGLDINDRITIEKDALRLTVLWTLHESEETMEASRELEEKAREMGLDTTNTGKMLLYQSMNRYVAKSFLSSLSIAMIAISLLLVLALRSLRLGFLALLTNVTPLVMGGALLKLLGQPLDVGTVIVASVCLGIAVDDTIHFIANYGRWREQGFSSGAAISRVISHTAPALVYTTFILVAAFGVFAFATFTPNRNFGLLTAATLSLALVVDLIFLPALLLCFPRRKTAAGEPQEARQEPEPA